VWKSLQNLQNCHVLSGLENSCPAVL
jgi:hypothetical protein